MMQSRPCFGGSCGQPRFSSSRCSGGSCGQPSFSSGGFSSGGCSGGSCGQPSFSSGGFSSGGCSGGSCGQPSFSSGNCANGSCGGFNNHNNGFSNSPPEPGSSGSNFNSNLNSGFNSNFRPLAPQRFSQLNVQSAIWRACSSKPSSICRVVNGEESIISISRDGRVLTAGPNGQLIEVESSIAQSVADKYAAGIASQSWLAGANNPAVVAVVARHASNASSEIVASVGGTSDPNLPQKNFGITEVASQGEFLSKLDLGADGPEDNQRYAVISLGYEGCSHCKILEGKIKGWQSQGANNPYGNVKFFHGNTESYPNLPGEFSTKSYPTSFVYDRKTGKQVGSPIIGSGIAGINSLEDVAQRPEATQSNPVASQSGAENPDSLLDIPSSTVNPPLIPKGSSPATTGTDYGFEGIFAPAKQTPSTTFEATPLGAPTTSSVKPSYGPGVAGMAGEFVGSAIRTLFTTPKRTP